MALGVHKTNCTLQAPGFGSRHLLITGVGFGKNIVSSQTEGARQKTFYTQVATSGEWFVTAVFRSYSELTAFEWWIMSYYDLATDPHAPGVLPMNVLVPSRSFHKTGYPVTGVDFGDSFGKVIYPMKINFVSASEPTITGAQAGKYQPPLRDSATSSHFYPTGVQEAGFVPQPFVSGTVAGGYKS